MKDNKEWLKYKMLMESRPESFINEGKLNIITDEEAVKEFEIKSGRTIGVVYESPYNLMVVDLVEDSEGKRFAYERLMPTVQRGAVVAVPVFNHRIVLLKQFRHAMRKEQYAFPRGFASEGLSPADNVLKELREELGATVKRQTCVGTIIADSGICGNEATVFLCDLNSIDVSYGHEGITDYKLVTKVGLERMIAEEKINDGFTLSAVALLDHEFIMWGE